MDRQTDKDTDTYTASDDNKQSQTAQSEAQHNHPNPQLLYYNLHISVMAAFDARSSCAKNSFQIFLLLIFSLSFKGIFQSFFGEDFHVSVRRPSRCPVPLSALDSLSQTSCLELLECTSRGLEKLWEQLTGPEGQGGYSTSDTATAVGLTVVRG